MTDSVTTIGELRELVEQFVSERDWHQFHAPKNLSMALAIEAAELMEHFQWIDPEASRQFKSESETLEQIGEELADVLCYALAMANELGLEVSEILQAKMKKNRLKYPAERYKGRYE